jgi:CRISPR-associated endonuclease/helicase Cas3
VRWRAAAGGDALARGITPEQIAHHPFQAEIISSTVAQIGSRLLFRGYGVGSRTLALAAGLAGVDTTICLDGAHLAGPFRETVASVLRLRDADSVALPPLALITLSATPDDAVAPEERVEIGEEDRALLGARLTGTKTAVLVEPGSPKDADRRAALVDAVVRGRRGRARRARPEGRPSAAAIRSAQRRVARRGRRVGCRPSVAPAARPEVSRARGAIRERCWRAFRSSRSATTYRSISVRS